MPNKPKILSNDLDQVPKKWERYRKELLKTELADQIADALTDPEDLPMGENDFFIGEGTDKKVLDRFLKHSDTFPVEQIGKMLKDHDVISCEISRVKKEKTGDWNKAVWGMIPRETVSLWEILSRNAKKKVDGYDISYLTFTKTAHNWWPTARISLQQVGFPKRSGQNPWGNVAMVSHYAVFYNEVKGKDVKEISL
jgi:hypothetical protein